MPARPSHCCRVAAAVILAMSHGPIEAVSGAPGSSLSVVAGVSSGAGTLCRQACAAACPLRVRPGTCPCLKHCELASQGAALTRGHRHSGVLDTGDGGKKFPQTSGRPHFFQSRPAWAEREKQNGTVSQDSATARPRLQAVCTPGGAPLPTLLLLGVQKAGTTSLYADMSRALGNALLTPVVPESRVATDPVYFKKELHFFDCGDRFAGGAELLGEYFAQSCDSIRKAGLLPVDATPNYFGTEEYPQHFGFGPDPRGDNPPPWARAADFYTREARGGASQRLVFVVILRDPAARYVSAFNHFCIREQRGGPYCNSILDSVKLAVSEPGCRFSAGATSLTGCPAVMLRLGIYWVPLSGWVRSFPDAQFIITTFSHYKRHSNEVISEIGRAIGADAKAIRRSSKLNINTVPKKQRHSEGLAEATKLLNDYYRWHSSFFWRVLEGLLGSNQHRITFLGKFGQF